MTGAANHPAGVSAGPSDWMLAMLTLLGPRLPGRTCDGVSRRDFLRIGALGVGGLTLADLLRLKAQGAVRSEAAHKAVIMVYLPGGPSHIDMYDLKPDAPAEYRGEFKPIRTNVPGIDVCELMPMHARIADKFSILRGLKTQGNHDPTELLTGIPGGGIRANRLGSPPGLWLRRQQAAGHRRRDPALRQRLQPQAARLVRRSRRAGLPRPDASPLRRGRAGDEEPDACARRDA